MSNFREALNDAATMRRIAEERERYAARMPPLRNVIRCDTCGRDVPTSGDTEHVVSVTEQPFGTRAIQITCAAGAPWWLRLRRWMQ